MSGSQPAGSEYNSKLADLARIESERVAAEEKRLADIAEQSNVDFDAMEESE